MMTCCHTVAEEMLKLTRPVTVIAEKQTKRQSMKGIWLPSLDPQKMHEAIRGTKTKKRTWIRCEVKEGAGEGAGG